MQISADKTFNEALEAATATRGQKQHRADVKFNETRIAAVEEYNGQFAETNAECQENWGKLMNDTYLIAEIEKAIKMDMAEASKTIPCIIFKRDPKTNDKIVDDLKCEMVHRSRCKASGKNAGAATYKQEQTCEEALDDFKAKAEEERAMRLAAEAAAAPKEEGPDPDACFKQECSTAKKGGDCLCPKGCSTIEWVSVDKDGVEDPEMASMQCVPVAWNQQARKGCLGKSIKACGVEDNSPCVWYGDARPMPICA